MLNKELLWVIGAFCILVITISSAAFMGYYMENQRLEMISQSLNEEDFAKYLQEEVNDCE